MHTVVITGTERTSEQEVLWNVAGAKPIHVTAENCGGSVVAHYGVQVVSPADLPDLVVSNAWPDLDQGHIGYAVRNQGNTTAPEAI